MIHALHLSWKYRLVSGYYRGLISSWFFVAERSLGGCQPTKLDVPGC